MLPSPMVLNLFKLVAMQLRCCESLDRIMDEEDEQRPAPALERPLNMGRRPGYLPIRMITIMMLLSQAT